MTFGDELVFIWSELSDGHRLDNPLHGDVITQDAYPVERGAFEFTLPLGFTQGGNWSTLPELAWGATWNAMIGVKAPVTDSTESSPNPPMRSARPPGRAASEAQGRRCRVSPVRVIGRTARI